jgi:hypothetical protein
MLHPHNWQYKGNILVELRAPEADVVELVDTLS